MDTLHCPDVPSIYYQDAMAKLLYIFSKTFQRYIQTLHTLFIFRWEHTEVVLQSRCNSLQQKEYGHSAFVETFHPFIIRRQWRHYYTSFLRHFKVILKHYTNYLSSGEGKHSTKLKINTQNTKLKQQIQKSLYNDSN